PGLFNRMTLSSLMAYSLLSTGMDDLEDHPEYAAYLSPSSTTFEHNSPSQAMTSRSGRAKERGRLNLILMNNPIALLNLFIVAHLIS
ncbi:hypothetical protein, partial [Methylocaldum sp.]|uniref:hypothetical protein n=1 Tax=Methylocaldum sp. TaxID=1969727 RepID=UPI002D3727A4